MRTMFLGISLLLATAPTVYAQSSKADQRAVDACKAQSPSFVQVADCLPAAHVAFKTLDAFDTIFPAEGHPLKSKCIELNAKNIVGAAICVTNAIDKAVDLKQSLPDGTTLEDPVFEAVSNADLAKKLKDAEKKAQSGFPKQQVWGGGIYYPYK